MSSSKVRRGRLAPISASSMRRSHARDPRMAQGPQADPVRAEPYAHAAVFLARIGANAAPSARMRTKSIAALRTVKSAAT